MYYFVSEVLFEIQGTGQVWNMNLCTLWCRKSEQRPFSRERTVLLLYSAMILFNTTKTNNTSILWLGIQKHKHPDASILSIVESFFLRICSLFTLWQNGTST